MRACRLKCFYSKKVAHLTVSDMAVRLACAYRGVYHSYNFANMTKQTDLIRFLSEHVEDDVSDYSQPVPHATQRDRMTVRVDFSILSVRKSPKRRYIVRASHCINVNARISNHLDAGITQERKATVAEHE